MPIAAGRPQPIAPPALPNQLVLAGHELAVPLFLVHRRGRLFSALQRDLMDAIRAAVGP
jgi:hypothetical protein